MKFLLFVSLLLGWVLFGANYLKKAGIQNDYAIVLLNEYLKDNSEIQKIYQADLSKVKAQVAHLKTEQQTITTWISRLDNALLFLLVIVLIKLAFGKFKIKVMAYDGLAWLLFPVVLFCGLVLMIFQLQGLFSASQSINALLWEFPFFVVAFLMLPFTIAAYFINQFELKHALHQQLWIFKLIRAFGVVLILLLFAFLFALLMVPDVSNFKN